MPKQLVTIKTTTSDVELVATVVGDLAVHPALGINGLSSAKPSWTLTWLPTGYRIEDWKNEQAAIEAAIVLAPHFEGARSLLNQSSRYESWREAVSPIIRAMLNWEGNIELPESQWQGDWS